jgi:probable rRNA maturation factor
MISFINKNINFTLSDKRILKKWIKSILDSHNYSVGDINYIFSNDEYVLQVNKQFLNHDYFTDIITFDTSSYSDNDINRSNFISADIFISVDTVLSNSSLYKTTFISELHRVIIHGILHLIGFNDLSNDDRSVMRQQENIALSLLSQFYE